METSLVKINGGWIFVRHTPISEFRQTILCLHGLGDSGLSFVEAFQSSHLKNFNVIVPDLMGHGCSSDAPDGDYSFGTQIKQLYAVVDELHVPEFFLVGHSLGGDIATHFAANDQDRVRGLINIEGNLTPPDVVISKQALKAAERGDFETWFNEDFMNKTVLNLWGAKWNSCKRYYASLWFCRPQAFLSTAREVCQRNSPLHNTAESETGLMFQQLKAPKAYCWGGSMSAQTTKIIKDKAIQNWGFEDAFHWPMIDKEKVFYQLLEEFVLSNKKRA
jgi:pimeloyl-ACP methyl ester carboxylesterase